ncbi:uncharacterized protein LOC123007523 isoform X2 [Tribolium madens]|uniref:uncharacterized protein LOC123007523 isoform X2 n=1 Tax=Tribolium madens TaxID=41895 RepID=UPI001CF764FA|nr:uncharacterized protein LOC123007523 isoform X2 [Tribolium madens]
MEIGNSVRIFAKPTSSGGLTLRSAVSISFRRSIIIFIMPSIRTCCVPNCGQAEKEGVILHQFPKSRDKKNEWLKRIFGTIGNIPPNSVICGKHFEITSYYKTKKLLPNAVPSLLLNYKRITRFQEGAEVQSVVHCKREKRTLLGETPEITTQQELAMERTIKTEVESDYEVNDCIKTESFFEAEDVPLIEVKTEISDIKTELESSQPRFILRATSVSPEHMHGSRNLVNEEIDNCKKRIHVLEQIQLRQSKKITQLENLLRHYTNK